MQFGDQIPTGTYLDMTANLPVVHPEKVLAPVLLVRGEYDGIAAVPDLDAPPELRGFDPALPHVHSTMDDAVVDAETFLLKHYYDE